MDPSVDFGTWGFQGLHKLAVLIKTLEASNLLLTTGSPDELLGASKKSQGSEFLFRDPTESWCQRYTAK